MRNAQTDKRLWTTRQNGIGMKNFSPTYKALGDYDINKIYVDKVLGDAR